MSNKAEQQARNIVGNEVDERKRDDEKAQEKRSRVPMYKQNALEFMDMKPGFRYRFVNDVYGRIDRFMRAGWDFVEGNTADTYSGKGRGIEAQKSSQIWRTVNNNKDASSYDAVLMCIPIEFYNQDQVDKADRILEDEKRLDKDGLIANSREVGGSEGLLVQAKLNKIK